MLFLHFSLIVLVRVDRALAAMHMLHKQRPSGKKIKQLLSEEAIIGIFFYSIKNNFGLSDWS